MATITIHKFIETHGITMEVEKSKANPNINEDDWSKDARHWKCKFRLGNRVMTVYFSQGSAHTEPPTAAEVLDCLAMDASGWESAGDFADWCSDFGYSPDSRKAEHTFQTIERQSDKLAKFLGSPTDYETLLWSTERL